MKFATLFLVKSIFWCVVGAVPVWEQFEQSKNIHKIIGNEFKPFISGVNVYMLYFFKTDLPRLRGFVNAYDKSAGYLQLYGVLTAVVDCREKENADIETCKEEGSELKVYSYSHGHELLQLELETMFDVNSIMSNILQLVLLREVPILQSKDERMEYENKYKGTNDIIFSYQKAIGTTEHRMFMEIAYAYQEKFKFAVTTTTESIEDLASNELGEENAAIWHMKCKEATDDMFCESRRYSGAMELSNLARFIKNLSLPPVFHMPYDGVELPYTQDTEMSLVFLYYRPAVKDIVMKQLVSLQKTLGNAAWFITVDVEEHFIDHPDYSGDTPAVAVQNIKEAYPVTMKVPWTEDTVFEFILERLEEASKPRSNQPPSSDLAQSSGPEVRDEENRVDDMAEDEEDNHVPEIETQDDHVAEAVYRAHNIAIDLDNVQVLTDKSFPTTVQSQDLLLVLFYLPFDHRSMAFLRVYGEASRSLENISVGIKEEVSSPENRPIRSLASVNCHDWTDVCGKENITLYPTVRIFRNGKIFKDYDGMLDSQEVVKTVKLMSQSSPVTLSTKEDVENFLVSDEDSNTKILGLFDEKHTQEVAVFQAVSDQLNDKFVFGSSTNGKGKEMSTSKFKCPLPCLIVIKGNDAIQPHKVHHGQFEKDAIINFIQTARIPVMPELTVNSFPALYRQGKPFVIAFLDLNDEARTLRGIISDIVRKEMFPHLIISWISCEGFNSFGTQILKFYDQEASVPGLAYVHLRESKVYTLKVEAYKADIVQKWIKDVEDGKVPLGRSLEKKEWKPKLEGYDFLKFIDKENKKKSKPLSKTNARDNVQLANEQGIGFDQDGNEIDIKEFYKPDGQEQIRNDDLDLEDETRKELFKSRLYHQSESRKHSSARDHHHHQESSGPRDFMLHDVTGLNEQDHKNKEDIPHTPHSEKTSSDKHKIGHTEL